MSARDDNDRARDGDLPHDPFEDAEPVTGAGPANDSSKPWTSPGDRARRLALANTPRIPTTIPTLNKATRGGLKHRTRVAVQGAPGSGKTTYGCHEGVTWARAGFHVAILAADEEADGLLIRLGQALGLHRDDLEHSDPTIRLPALERAAELLDEIPTLHLVDADEDEATVESVDAQLAALAGESISILIVDSIQTVRAAGSTDADSPRLRVDAVLAALKAASRHHLVIFTSEINRGAYREVPGQQRPNDLAAGKESGGIEYGAHLVLLLRSVADEHDLVDVGMPKNRLGQKLPWRMRINFSRASFAEVDLPQSPSGSGECADLEFERDVEEARDALRKHPGINGNEAWIAKFKGGKREVGTSRARGAVRFLYGNDEVENRGTRKQPRLYLRSLSEDESPESPESPEESPGETGEVESPESPQPVRAATSAATPSRRSGDDDFERGSRRPGEAAE